MNTTKFKVGDRVRYMHPGHHTGTIILIDNFIINIKRDDGLRGCGWQGSWTGDEESYKLIAPSPLKNTIITDIKDGAQHRRIQEKLFSMGHRWMGGQSTVQNYGSGVRNMIAIGNKDMFQSPINESSYDHISANEFLRETKTAREITNKYSARIHGMFPVEVVIPENKWFLESTYGESVEPLTKKHLNGAIKYLNNNNNKTIMNTEQSFPCGVAAAGKSIVSFAKDLLLSPNEKLLRKCGLHDEYGKNTNDARELIMNKFLNSPENQAYLLEVAEAKQADEKANK